MTKRNLRNESTEEGRRLWAAVDRAAANAPSWAKERMMGKENRIKDPPQGSEFVTAFAPESGALIKIFRHVGPIWTGQKHEEDIAWYAVAIKNVQQPREERRNIPISLENGHLVIWYNGGKIIGEFEHWDLKQHYIRFTNETTKRPTATQARTKTEPPKTVEPPQSLFNSPAKDFGFELTEDNGVPKLTVSFRNEKVIIDGPRLGQVIQDMQGVIQALRKHMIGDE